MKHSKYLFASLLFCFSFHAFSQGSKADLPNGYISEELFIFIHTGAGNNYRILGTINAGEQVQLTGKQENEYTEIVTDKERIGWVESKFVTTKPGLRFAVADLNERLASGQTDTVNLSNQLSEAQDLIVQLKNERASLQNEISALNVNLTQSQSKLKTQDTDIKKEWFFNGAIVLGIGLLFGLILPRLFAKRKSSMSSWS